MTSPIDAWNERYTLDQVRLPGDIDELAVICCESDTRTVSHIGIELENCIFNNSMLQQLRRRAAPGGQIKVQLRYNTARMDRIWVQDPVTLQRFEVLNRDPDTNDLSAKQVAALELIRRKSQSTGTVITRAQARKKIEEIYRPLLQAKTMLERRRAMKILGLIANEDPIKQAKSVKPKALRNATNSNNIPANTTSKSINVRAAKKSSTATSGSFSGTSPPKFKVVLHGSIRDHSDLNVGRSPDAN